jgi:hypothetical protein
MNYASLNPKQRETQINKEMAKGVIEELNNSRFLPPPAVERLANVLTRLHALRLKEANGEFIHPDEANPINEYLSHHQWITQLVVAAGPWLYFQNEEVVAKSGADANTVIALTEQRVGAMVVELASNGNLERIQRCDQCGTWFYGRLRLDPTKGTFHSSACRKRFWRSRPDVKEHLREYQKGYYRDVLSPVTSRAVKRKKRRVA